ncbi:MAG: hypothetical protein CMG35_12045 [Candidatus Marinimicrobia bacterium]|jgi:hypothetical protein|nr:hypothetical protein [Candidatus Neomarinimicrobiota bacterium]MBO03363.1 hypothetical protein [Candidatus Neomarinimicrobiota bacterium]|tara:strand:- start:3152 stop:4090 length:939 start_codon:yes stop_codon:yes gene_type:complete
MAISGFNQLANRIASTADTISTTAQTINAFNRGLGSGGNLMNTVASIGRGAQTVSNTVTAAQAFLGGSTRGNLGSSIRMFGNASQGVRFNAAPPDPMVKRAIVSNSVNPNFDGGDWRVSISVPPEIQGGPILAPLTMEGGNSKMVFPFNPTILLGHSANYSPITPTHTNYAYNAYQNSQVDNITITGEFYNENENDAKYWVAVLHFLRSVTKMFYGDSNPQGNPPPVCRLNGYGPHVLSNIPIVVTNFTTDLPADVDYIECTVPGASKRDLVPVQSQFTVTVMPQYSRRSTAKFNLQQFANGDFTTGTEGFV